MGAARSPSKRDALSLRDHILARNLQVREGMDLT